MRYLVQGLILGLAYVAPIGMQNMYVINTAMHSSLLRALQVALVTICFDVSLALACFFGVGAILFRFPVLRMIVMLVGSLAVLGIGIGLLKSKPGFSSGATEDQRLHGIILSCFAVTWLNPQAVIDGSLLLGGWRASLSPSAATLFITGVASASFIWFLGLATLVSCFRRILSPRAMRSMNVLCGLILIGFAVRMGLGVVALLH